MGVSCLRSLNFHIRFFLFALTMCLFIILLQDLTPRKRNTTWNQWHILVLSTIQYHFQSEPPPWWAFTVSSPLLSFTVNDKGCGIRWDSLPKHALGWPKCIHKIYWRVWRYLSATNGILLHEYYVKIKNVKLWTVQKCNSLQLTGEIKTQISIHHEVWMHTTNHVKSYN